MSEEAETASVRTETDLERAEREYQVAREAIIAYRAEVAMSALRAERMNDIFQGPLVDELERLLDDLSSRATVLYVEIARDELLTALAERDAERDAEREHEHEREAEDAR